MINMQYDCLLKATGMDSIDAAKFHGGDEDVIYMWVSGDEEPSQHEIDKISDLICRMAISVSEVLDHIIDQMEEHGSGPDVLELGLASDDQEAGVLGWPNKSAHKMLLGMTAAQMSEIGIKVSIVPRGSTVPSAAAADAFEQGLED